MSRRKSKTTKLLDALVVAAERRALRGSRPAEEYEEIDEEYFLARTHVQYYVEQLEKRMKQAEKNWSGK